MDIIDTARATLEKTPRLHTFLRASGVEAHMAGVLLATRRLAGGMPRERVSVGPLEAQFHTGSEARQFLDRAEDERPVLLDIAEQINSDDVFYDIGAHHGVYSCLVGNELSEGRVVAFEPMSLAVAYLRQNLATNGVPSEVHQFALGADQEETPSDWLDLTSEGGGVRTAVGDTLRDETDLPFPTLVKIDVEGGELGVIRGLSETLSHSDCRLVYCELHPVGTFENPELAGAGIGEEDRAEIERLLEEAGFEIESIHERGSQPFLRAEK